MAANWTDAENDAIVADYFAMLEEDLARRPYNKADHNRQLQMTTGRSHGSIEFKHRNISAVLMALGEVWMSGYRPAPNVQTSLVDAVVRWLGRHPRWLASISHGEAAVASLGTQENPILWIGPPPTQSNLPPPKELEEMAAIARRHNVAERDARNRALGRAGEERVLVHERAQLAGAGRSDLAERVRWVADLDGDGAGYDIHSFNVEGTDRLIEVKTTRGWERTPFFITRNELDVAGSNRDTWLLLRLWNFAREPRAFELRPPLQSHVSLMATTYQATPF